MATLSTNDWCVYMLQCSDGSLYTGITNDLDKRLKTHEAGRGSKYVRSKLPFVLWYVVHVATRSEASKMEARLKREPRAKKLQLGHSQ